MKISKKSNSNSYKIKLGVKYKKYLIKICVVSLFILIISFFIFISKSTNRSDELEYKNKISEIFKENPDINLFLKNKTEYYYERRKQ